MLLSTSLYLQYKFFPKVRNLILPMLEIHHILNVKTIKWLSPPSPEIEQKYSSFAITHSIAGTKSHLSNLVL